HTRPRPQSHRLPYTTLFRSNPVAAIRASAEVLDEGGALEEPEEARRFVKRIRESTARIERLLGDLLNLAQIEARGIDQFDVLDRSEEHTSELQSREKLVCRL